MPSLPPRKQINHPKRIKSVNHELYQSKRWKQLRPVIINRDLFCKVCGEGYQENKYFQIDHIKPILQGGDEWDEDNLQLLCKNCHDVKTAKERRL